MIESKIKEVQEKDNFPALYCNEGRAKVILVMRELSTNELEGVVMHPKSMLGEYAMNWSKSEFSRMGKGSELTIKILQE